MSRSSDERDAPKVREAVDAINTYRATMTYKLSEASDEFLAFLDGIDVLIRHSLNPAPDLSTQAQKRLSPETCQEIVREKGMCGELSPDGLAVCVLLPDHDEPHPWAAPSPSPTGADPEKRWTIYVCSRCGSPEDIQVFGEAVNCRACSIHHMRVEAPTIEVCPASENIALRDERDKAQAELEWIGVMNKTLAEAHKVGQEELRDERARLAETLDRETRLSTGIQEIRDWARDEVKGKPGMPLDGFQTALLAKLTRLLEGDK